jgi:4-amino-4-deoxy-L-arabinose transferase-like glycosyltransferase
MLVLGIFGLGLAVRVGTMIVAGRAGKIEHTEIINVARSITENGLFGNPYETASTGATAHVAPIYPYVVAILLRLFGWGPNFDWAVHALTAAAASAQCAILPVLAGAWLGDRRIGVLPALVAALLPLRLWTETAGAHEAVYAGLALALLFWGAARFVSPELPSMRFFAWYGVGWGCAALVSPVVLPALGALLAVWLYWNRNRRALQAAGLLLVCCGAILLPWTLRNYLSVGTLSLVRDNFGLELAVSNNDFASPLMDDNYDGGPTGAFRHPYSNNREGAIMRSMGETAYYRIRAAEATKWIERNPGRFTRLTLQRIFWFWFTPSHWPLKTMFHSGVVVLGAIGLWFLWRDNRRAACLLSVLWVIFPLPFYAIQIGSRYRYPMEWLLWLLAGYTVWIAAERVMAFRTVLHRSEVPL